MQVSSNNLHAVAVESIPCHAMDDMHCQLVQAPPGTSLVPPGVVGDPSACSSFVLAAACLLFFMVAAIVIIKGSNENNAPQPPGRGRYWSVVETLSFVAANSSGRGFYHFVQARHRRYGGPCFRTALFGHTHVFVSSPDAARSLLQSTDKFSKRYVRTVADLLGEHSLLCASHDDAHRALRRAIAPLFNARATASLAATFDALTCDWLAATTSNRTVVLLDAALGITFEAICDMLMATLPPDTKRQLQSDVLAVTRAMLAVPLRLPGTRFYAGLKARKRIMDLLTQEIASRKRRLLLFMEDEQQHQHQNHLNDDDDFLQSLLLRQQQSPSSGLTDDQILDNILTLIIAGQVTTATAITWMVKYLADNRDLQENLRSVQMELALKQQQDAPLTLQHLNSMELAYMTVKESLRMASIVSWFPRVALEDCQVAGFRINKGWIVNIDARALHYDPTVYENPTMFDPSRFNLKQGEGGDNKQQQQALLLVFGAGGRTCLGMNLAKIMMLIFLHRLVTTWRWEMADDDPSLEEWAMFPRLRSGCPLHLTPI